MFSTVRNSADVTSDSSSSMDDEQQSTVKLLADARRMAYVKGRWVYTDTGSEQLYQIVSPTLPGNGDYSLASKMRYIYCSLFGVKFLSCGCRCLELTLLHYIFNYNYI